PILEPNINKKEQYQTHTKKINEQSQNFANVFQRTVWTNPEYDYTLEQPVASQAIIARNEAKARQDDDNLRRIASTRGLLFFFQSDCPICHRMAPILKKFAEDYGMTVIPISLDGGGLPEFPYPKMNYAAGRRLDVKRVPALFLVDPETDTIDSIGYGYSDYTTFKAKVLNAYSEPSHAKIN
ncbi:MAG: conjugal transfer protein TraF, partial [Pseudobdellovibrionaceae bacterium]|nr:conjugal transfer protein TraF [Pseudobdellovibrionaceae bacterium]